jgi:integrase
MPVFADYAKEWLEVYVKVYSKAGTYDLQRRIIENHLEPAFGKLKLDEVSRPMVESFIAQKIEEKLAKGTVRNYVQTLRGILAKAVRDEILTVNRTSRMGQFQKETSSKAAAKKIVPLTPAELQILFAKAREKDFALYVFFLTAVLTGLRISELIGLQWGDIDFVNHVLYVKRAITHRRMETPKSHNLRCVDLSEDLEPVVQRLLAYRKAQWLKKGLPIPEWVFSNDEGNYLNEFHLRTRTFYPLIKAARLRSFRIHDLRHTYASMLLQNGESVAYVRDQMGHHSIQITVDTYGHFIPGSNRAAANRLGRTILGPVKKAAQNE